MAIELRWLASTTASSLHTAQALLAGAKLLDASTSESLAIATRSLADTLVALGFDEQNFFQHAIPLSARYGAPRQLAEVVLAKLGGTGDTSLQAVRLSQELAGLYAAFDQSNPRALEELELRGEPLCGQWEARGPGLLATVGRLTEKDLLVPAADVILLQPALGGAGASHWLYNSVSIEAVLANPIAALPEVVRLGWLLSQLHLDLPKHQGNVNFGRLQQVGPLAMIPPVLAAAEEVELARMDEPTVVLALTAWTDFMIEPGKLLEWWDTYQSTGPAWVVALGALERILDA